MPNLSSHPPTLQNRSYAGLVGAAGCVVVCVEGRSENVGKTIQLPSGATIKLKADGAWVYNIEDAIAANETSAKAVDAVRYQLIEGTKLQSGVLSICIDCLGEPQILTEKATTPDSDRHAPISQPITQPIRIIVNSTTRNPVQINLLDACDHTNESSTILLLQDSDHGNSQIDDMGVLTFTPASSFAGNTQIKCLVEQLDGATQVVEIMLSITAPVQFSAAVNC